MAEPTLLNGAYRLIRVVDSGATAQVYLAEDTATGQKVAVKRLRPDLASQPDFVSRFQREALLLEHLRHPNLVRLIRLVNNEEGLYLLLEWVEGRRLDHVLKDEGPLAGHQALDVLRHLALALEALHGAGIVHRDLKPENVMVERGPEGLTARLLDLGVARFLDRRRAAATFQSLQGSIAGTPAYLSPEQILALPAATQSDVYSFGVLGFLLLAGRPPFEHPTHHGLMQLHLGEPAPGLVPLDAAVAGHPALHLVERCLEKEPRLRPKDGAALVAALAG